MCSLVWRSIPVLWELTRSLTSAWATLDLLRCIRRVRTHISIDNPFSLALWKWDPLLRELERHHVTWTRTDYCCWGAPYQKAIYFVSSLPGLDAAIGRRCSCTLLHLRLQGIATVPTSTGSKRVWLTSLAGKYPPQLCRAFARCARAAAPRSAHLPRPAGPQHGWRPRLAGLAAALGCDFPRVPDPHCPRLFASGWEGVCD